jgi:molybdopterin-guanine dinucleotide biosynthesis protein A
VLDEIRTLVVDEDEVRRFDSDGASFFNMNTPDDYAQALQRWNAVSVRISTNTGA